MISYERIDKSDFIDFNKSKESKECMICHYWYFRDGFKYQPYVCNRCHDFNMGVQSLSTFLILTIKNIDYRVYIANVDKKMPCIFLKILFFMIKVYYQWILNLMLVLLK